MLNHSTVGEWVVILKDAAEKVLVAFERHYFYIFIVLFLLYLSPLTVMQEDSYVTIHDDLDSLVAWRTVLARSGKTFDSKAKIEQIMNGIPRVCLPSALNALTWLFLVFKPFTAYLINHILVHSVAFAGMYLLLRRYLAKDGLKDLVAVGVAFCFAILPFYTSYGLSVAGQPLLLFAFLNILARKSSIGDYLIIGAFPFYSSLVHSGVFIISVFGIWFVIDWFRNRKPNFQFALGILLLASTYLVAEYNLIDSMFISRSFVSHRTEWILYAKWMPFFECIRKAASNFRFGQYHAASLHTLIVMTAIPLAFASACVGKLDLAPLLTLLALILLFSLIYGFQGWEGLVPIRERIPVLSTFQFGRFHWLHPTLWYLAFALSLSMISRMNVRNPINARRSVVSPIIVGLIILQILLTMRENVQVMRPARNVIRRMMGKPASGISYGEFYSEDLFQAIERYIGRPQEDYRVVSIGMHPSIAQYNGFYTLDGYQANYPLEYKHRFRRVIAQELQKNKRWRDYFDSWGSRCYVFVDGVPSVVSTKDQAVKVANLDLGIAALKEMGGEYILSAVEILNYQENDLQLLNVFENEESPWRVYLYQVG